MTLTRTVPALLLVTLSGCISVSVTERALVRPVAAEESSAALETIVANLEVDGLEATALTVGTQDGTALSAVIVRQPGADVTVLYFGGNGYTVERFGSGTARAFVPLGVNVVLVDHRGYGWSGGTPTVARLQSDALDVFDHVRALEGVGRLVVHGQSLGSFLAAHVGARRPAAGVVLESSATTPEEWARTRVPVLMRPLVRVEVEDALVTIDNRAEVAAIEEPLLLVVGADDGITPPTLSERLFEASPLPDDRKTLVRVPDAGHNDVKTHPAFAEVYRAFLDDVRAAPAPPAVRLVRR